jgi:hypothetical protein
MFLMTGEFSWAISQELDHTSNIPNVKSLTTRSIPVMFYVVVIIPS